MMIRRAVCALAVSSCLLASAYADDRPNIVFIMSDDVGFSDLSSYGSEIKTPNIDALANQGVRFSNYYTSASCAPSRAMALTGIDAHRAGLANISEAVTPAQSHSPFYQAFLRDEAITIAQLLKDSGYDTMMAGKWHLGYETKKLRPISKGFDQTLMMPFSGGDNYDHRSYLPMYDQTLWFKNGEPYQLPDNFYSSEGIIDETIAQIERTKDSGKPFFSYVSFQAVHIPVQAPFEHTEKYLDTYKDGWDALRERRQMSVKAAGMIAEDAPMKRAPTTDDWNALSADEKAHASKAMAVYAGMMDAMDLHIGRLVQYLKDTNQYDNTIFIFTSDNGAEGADAKFQGELAWRLMLLDLGYNDDIETLGERGSYNYIGTSFANSAVSPLGEFKMHAGEGGIRVPLIVSGPIVNENIEGEITHSRAFVKDVAATILSAANVTHPGANYQGKVIEPLTGKNLAPVLNDLSSKIYADDEYIAYEIGGNAALLKGDYKIMISRGEGHYNEWQLFNIRKDPGETTPLQSIETAKFQELLSDYEHYVKQNGVIEVPADYLQLKQVTINNLKVIAKRPSTLIVLGLLTVLIGWALARLTRRLRLKR